MLWYKIIVPGNHTLLRNVSQMRPIFRTSTHLKLYTEKVYWGRLKVAGMGTKLTFTQVTAMNTQRERPASVSHCK